MSTVRRTPTRIKFNSMVFIHNAKASPENHYSKETAVINGIKYYRMREEAICKVEVLTEAEQAAYDLINLTITIPSKDELRALEQKDMIVDEEGSIKTVANKPAIIEHSSGKKTKRLFLNTKTGNYVSYIRALQLGLNKSN